MIKSALEIARASYTPKKPAVLDKNVTPQEGEATTSVADSEEIKRIFPNTYGRPIIKFVESDAAESYTALNVGVILSGGQAPGGHNVIAGIFDGIKRINKESKLYGFILGPGGLINHEYKELTGGYIYPFSGVYRKDLTMLCHV